MTKTRKRDLRTRVPDSVYCDVQRYAQARQLTAYSATEHLIVLGLETLSQEDATSARLQHSLDSVDGRLSTMAQLLDRTLYTAAIGYAYARHVAVDQAPEHQRVSLDEGLAGIGRDAYQRQRALALGGE